MHDWKSTSTSSVSIRPCLPLYLLDNIKNILILISGEKNQMEGKISKSSQLQLKAKKPAQQQEHHDHSQNY